MAAVSTAVTAEVADVLYDSASVVMTVTSHATGFPFRHGTRVKPSGWLPFIIIIIIISISLELGSMPMQCTGVGYIWEKNKMFVT